jgi:hypothetical protein
MLQNTIEVTKDHFQSSLFQGCGKYQVYNIILHFTFFIFFQNGCILLLSLKVQIRNLLRFGFGFSFVFIYIPKTEFSTTVTQSSEQNCTES